MASTLCSACLERWAQYGGYCRTCAVTRGIPTPERLRPHRITPERTPVIRLTFAPRPALERVIGATVYEVMWDGA